jgi:hypothetical protein
MSNYFITKNINENYLLVFKCDRNFKIKDLDKNTLDNLISDYGEYLKIPLYYFKTYYDDELLLSLPLATAKENNFLEDLEKLNFDRNYKFIFYVIVIDNKIISSGLNMIMTIVEIYYPECPDMFFKFSLDGIVQSRWDNAKVGSEILFNDDIFKYFDKYQKVKHGMFEIHDYLGSGVMLPINNNK